MNREKLDHIVIGKVNHPGLIPDMERIRSGSTQLFRKVPPNNREFTRKENADFIIEPPEPHIFAKLIEGEWYWVNGCDECNGREGSWVTYIKCEKHDVCCVCGISRSKLTAVPWGHPKGFKCQPCAATEKALKAAEGLAKHKNDDEWDFRGMNSVTCPYCGEEKDEPDFYAQDVEDVETTCYTCDNKFTVTAEWSVSFTTRRKEWDAVLE